MSGCGGLRDTFTLFSDSSLVVFSNSAFLIRINRRNCSLTIYFLSGTGKCNVFISEILNYPLIAGNIRYFGSLGVEELEKQHIHEHVRQKAFRGLDVQPLTQDQDQTGYLKMLHVNGEESDSVCFWEEPFVRVGQL